MRQKHIEFLEKIADILRGAHLTVGLQALKDENNAAEVKQLQILQRQLQNQIIVIEAMEKQQ